MRDYQGLLKRYTGYADIQYPGKSTLKQAIGLIQRVLVKQTDNIALIDELLAVQDDFDEILDDLDNVEQFFESQADLFNEAFYFKKTMELDMEYLQEKPETVKQLDKIRAILLVQPNRSYDYTRIPQLRGLIDTVRAAQARCSRPSARRTARSSTSAWKTSTRQPARSDTSKSRSRRPMAIT